MFAQFFGGYLLNKGLVSSQDLTTAIEDKKNTRMRLGVLAINAGLMTAQQVEHVNITQQSVDMLQMMTLKGCFHNSPQTTCFWDRPW